EITRTHKCHNSSAHNQSSASIHAHTHRRRRRKIGLAVADGLGRISPSRRDRLRLPQRFFSSVLMALSHAFIHGVQDKTLDHDDHLTQQYNRRHSMGLTYRYN
ncbi:unnamed protein product, partial [Urochloa humidicola]